MTDAEFVELADELALYAGDPVKFVTEMFDWNSPELKGKHPEPWQVENTASNQRRAAAWQGCAAGGRKWPRRWQNLFGVMDSSVGNQHA
jgi:hypothetical protein